MGQTLWLTCPETGTGQKCWAMDFLFCWDSFVSSIIKACFKYIPVKAKVITVNSRNAHHTNYLFASGFLLWCFSNEMSDDVRRYKHQNQICQHNYINNLLAYHIYYTGILLYFNSHLLYKNYARITLIQV